MNGFILSKSQKDDKGFVDFIEIKGLQFFQIVQYEFLLLLMGVMGTKD